MKITAKFSGSCAHCGATWSEGQECEYRKGCSPICVTCATAGKVPPEKDAKSVSKPGLSHTISPPPDSTASVLADLARRIEVRLTEILTEIRAAKRPARAQNTPSPEVSAIDSEVPF